jgi:hypothetical protein
MTHEDVASAFIQLESAAAFIPNEYATKEASIATGWGSALLAIDSNGRHHLLLPVEAIGSAPIDQHSSGVHVLPLVLDTKSKSVKTAGKAYKPNFVAVVCLKENLNDVFNFLAADILKSVVQQPTEPEKAARQVLEKWREFLNRERPLRLADNEVSGLIGELLILEALVALSTASIMNWHGPDKRRHDFANVSVALEVKTTTARSGWKFEIHGHDQLESPASTPLCFAGIRLQKDPAGSITLPSLVGRIAASGISAMEFEKKLLDAGYVSGEAKHYESLRYEEKERRFYLVDASFPRLISLSFLNGKVPVGVENIRYSINLNGTVPIVMEQPALFDLLSKLALS